MAAFDEGNELAQCTAEAVARRSYGKLVAFLAARTGDVAAAEDALSEAFAAALEDWPKNGCPANPEAWLLTVARRKSIDALRRRARIDEDVDPASLGATAEDVLDRTEIPDRRLALLFACAHPAIDAGIHAPLMLQTILGLDAKAIAAAFLLSPAAMGKRLVRAKEKIRFAAIPLAVPQRDEMTERLNPVLEAIYAAFAEGWSDPAGTDAARRDLTGEALFLASMVVELLPEEPEAPGLMALMLHLEARRRARRNASGEFVPLDRQDPQLWDRSMIEHAEGLLLRASAMGRLGRYQLEAAIQSAHVERCRTGRANWEAVRRLYDALIALTGSPVAAVNRALAIAEIEGPGAALASMPNHEQETRLSSYQPYWAARAELLGRAGRQTEARHALEVAIGLAADAAVRSFLERRRGELAEQTKGE
jgi:predicted RNA polymerase sigma factor